MGILDFSKQDTERGTLLSDCETQTSLNKTIEEGALLSDWAPQISVNSYIFCHIVACPLFDFNSCALMQHMSWDVVFIG